MIASLILVFFVLGLIYIKVNNIHLDFKSFFQKGFKRVDDIFRNSIIRRQTRKRKNI